MKLYLVLIALLSLLIIPAALGQEISVNQLNFHARLGTHEHENGAISIYSG